jgi:5-hydroxyisourate hydrolase-like protein (transthyretin family)
MRNDVFSNLRRCGRRRSPATDIPDRRVFQRRLLVEHLEDRRVLSASVAPELHGMYLVDPDVDNLRGQVVYLDYDGEEDVTYNGPVTLGPFGIPPFEAPGELAGQEDAIMGAVVDQLNELFAPVEVTFTLDRPDVPRSYSTVYIGGDGAWASEYRKDFVGIAEKVDIGNQDPADNAFVFSERIIPSHSILVHAASAVVSVIAHETAHLIGMQHINEVTDSTLANLAFTSTNPSAAILSYPPATSDELALYAFYGGTVDTSLYDYITKVVSGSFTVYWDVQVFESIPFLPDRKIGEQRYETNVSWSDTTQTYTIRKGYSPTGTLVYTTPSSNVALSMLRHLGVNAGRDINNDGWPDSAVAYVPLDTQYQATARNNCYVKVRFVAERHLYWDAATDWVTAWFRWEDAYSLNYYVSASTDLSNQVRHATVVSNDYFVDEIYPDKDVDVVGKHFSGGTQYRFILSGNARNFQLTGGAQGLVTQAIASDSSYIGDGDAWLWDCDSSDTYYMTVWQRRWSTTQTYRLSVEVVSEDPVDPSILVTLPGGGEVWPRGTNQTIAWHTGTDQGANVKIDLYKDGSYDRTISNLTPNNGSFSWPISSSQALGSNYRVKITSTSNSSSFDYSGSFSITETTSIRVTAPNGSEVWPRESYQTITWHPGSNQGQNVKIELYKSGTFDSTIVSSTSNNGSYQYWFPSWQAPGSDYKVKITSTSNVSYYDWSDANFSLTTAPSITVMAPNGGETWLRGTNQTITWDSSGSPGPYVKIDLFKSGAWNRTIVTSTYDSGSYPWTVPLDQALGNDFKIKITSTANSLYSDVSNNGFSIDAAPTITVSSPNGGERWQRGTSKTIAWSFSGDPGPNVSIELYKGGSFHSTVVASTANNGSYAWPVPPGQTIGSDYKVRITSSSNSSIFDLSDEAFSIEDVPTSITVTSPNGGEAWPQRMERRIRWDSSGLPGANVKIQLFKGGILDRTIIDSAPNSGWYDWFISSEFQLASDYRIKVTSTTNSTYSDSSDDDFSITDPPVTVTAPNGGESWQRGTTQNITWSWTVHSGSTSRIYLLKDGVRFRTIDESAPNTGSFWWPIPSDLPLGSDYKIQVFYSVWGDLSDEDFSITDASITITSPNGGETWKQGTRQTITWDSSGSMSLKVAIDLYKGEHRYSTIASEAPNSGSYSWHVLPSGVHVGDDYRVRVASLYPLPRVIDFSDHSFSISARSVLVTSPNGGEVWERGSSQRITWAVNDDVGPNVDIILYRSYPTPEGTSTYIAKSVPNNFTYDWGIPADQPLGNDFTIYLKSSSNHNYYDVSDSYFSIADASSITVTAPNGGESWQRGTTQAITWDAAGDPGANVRIELYKGGVFNGTIAGSAVNIGSYPWPISADQTLGGDYKVKITSTANSSYSDWSDISFSITAAPAITVTSPNGGESWQQGTSQAITWNFTGDPGANVRIELYRGETFDRTIASSTPNAGQYSWSIPAEQMTGEDYRVKIMSTSDSSYSDRSDNVFTITEPPRPTITSPNGGEVWMQGTRRTITWTSTGDIGASVRIYLVQDLSLLATFVAEAPNNGSYEWSIPLNQQVGNDYRICITSAANSVYSDWSDNSFSISAAPSITVTAPNGGESWQQGTSQTITWDSSGAPGANVSIELHKGGVLNRTIVSSTANDGTHPWLIPADQTLGSDYKVKIASTTNSSYSDWSDNSFSISAAPSITVTVPNGSESWQQGTSQTITWDASGAPGANVSIELHKGGVLNRTIASSTANDGTHPWLIPADQTLGSDYKVKIVSTTNSSYSDWSDNSFSISAAPSITVTAPNGSESWQQGTSQTITWDSSGAPGANVSIELHKGGVLNRTITSSTANDGTHPWLIPADQTLGSDYKVKIASTTNSSYFDWSDNSFSISAAPSITVTAPNGSESWQQGTSQTITWDASGAPGANVSIELYKGGVLNRTIASSTANDGTHLWLIPADQTLGSDYKVKIASTTNSSYSDWSDNSFSITAAPSITVTAPNGGENWQQGTSQTITWDASGDPGANVSIELYKGGVLNSSIASSTANDGTHSWQIPGDQTAGSDYKIKITSTTNTSYFDWSNDNFSVTATEWFSIISPRAFDSWQQGTSQTITWFFGGAPGANVRIELYKGEVLNRTIVSSTTNDGTHPWLIPGDQAAGSDYRIKITSTTNTSYFDWSDGFCIMPAFSPKVWSPNGGEVWQHGTNQTIRWVADGSQAPFRISLYRETALASYIANSVPNTESFLWDVSPWLPEGNNYRVKIESILNSSYFDWSDDNFSISAAPSITVTAPNGGESWQQGTSQTITWDASGDPGANVSIELHKGGVLNRTIASSTANDGTHPWQIPGDQTAGSDYKIKITSTTNSSYSDWSDNSFSITAAPSITVTAPNGGENWQQGTSQTITWDASGDPGANVSIELYKGGVLNSSIASSTANDGTHSWQIPGDQTAGSDYKIKITSTTNTSYFDWSDNGFSITPSSPANDNFADRVAITGALAIATGTNVGATKEPGEPSHAGNSGGASVWWTWVSACTSSVQIDTFGSSFDTLLGVYTGTRVSELTLVASNDDSGAGLTSKVTFGAVEGTAYQIAVDGYGGASSNIILRTACLYPALLVVGNGVEIQGGDAVPNPADGTDFGKVGVGVAPVTRTFTVQNTGDATLTTNNLTVPPGFTITEGLSSSIGPGESDSFSVRLDTTVRGTKSGEIRFESNDDAKNSFRFRITGTVVNLFEDFEKYPGGEWASGWHADGNAASDPSRNLVITETLDLGNMALQLHGVVGQFWGALAYHPVDFGESYALSLRIYNGDEVIPSTGHQQRAGVGMLHGTYWSNPGFALLSCKKDGNMIAADGSVLQSYSTNRWYDVRIGYQRNFTEIQVSYRIDGVNRGVVSVPVSDWLDNNPLDQIALSANAGTARFDDVSLVHRMPVVTWQNPQSPFDVSGSGTIEAFDVLLLVNEINRNESRDLPPRTLEYEDLPYFDVNGDGYLTPLDVLLVINFINVQGSPPAAPGGSGEGESVTEWAYSGQMPLSPMTVSIPDRPETLWSSKPDDAKVVQTARAVLVQRVFEMQGLLDLERELPDWEMLLNDQPPDDADLDAYFGKID